MRPLLPVLLAALLLAAGALPAVAAGGSAVGSAAPAATAIPSSGAPPAVAPAGAPAPDAAPNASSLNGTTVLLVPGASGEGFADGATSLGTALDVQRDGFDGRLSLYALESRFDRQTSPAGRRAVLERTLDGVEARADALSDDETRARTAFANGSIGATAYLARLARIDAAATSLTRLTRRVGTLDGDSGTTAFTNRTRYLRMRLALLTGPVRHRAAAALQGTAPPVRVYVAGGASGTMLSAVFNDTYVTETTRLDHFDGATPGTSVDLNAAFNRSADLYPYAWNASSTQRVDSLGTDVYHIALPYSGGRVEAYVDGTTGQVFREVQTKALAAVALGPPTSERRADVVLTAYRTHAGGPLLVRLVDGDGAPLSGTVRVGGTPVGSTANGTLWTVGAGSEFVVSADRGATQIPLIVRPVDQPVTGGTANRSTTG